MKLISFIVIRIILQEKLKLTTKRLSKAKEAKENTVMNLIVKVK
jgi:hypothetical protein